MGKSLILGMYELKKKPKSGNEEFTQPPPLDTTIFSYRGHLIKTYPKLQIFISVREKKIFLFMS